MKAWSVVRTSVVQELWWRWHSCSSTAAALRSANERQARARLRRWDGKR